MNYDKRLIVVFVIVSFFLSGCALFQSGRSDIRSFDRKYLKSKYVGKTGWAKSDMGGIKQGQKLLISGIEFGHRTIVRLKSGMTDFFFIIYSNRQLGIEKKDNKPGPVAYDINTIEQEIGKRIAFLAP